MTVAELIETLEQYPNDLQVRTGVDDTISLTFVEEYYDGDSANPKCPIIQALLIT